MRPTTYLRPGNLQKVLTIEPATTQKTTTGRAKTSYDTETGKTLRGVIASANPEAVQQYSQNGHPCTHQIVQQGDPRAKPGDRLAYGHAYYYILGVDNIGGLGVYTIYYTEERTDLDHGSQL